jgi:uncharacterized protein with PQ loop repeat
MRGMSGVIFNVPYFPIESTQYQIQTEAVSIMHIHSLSMLAGFASSTIFISSNLPMLFKAVKTKDLSSYSLGHLTLGTLGNLIYWLYVISLPLGPVWVLQAFFTLASVSMLFCYLRYEMNWFRY